MPLSLINAAMNEGQACVALLKHKLLSHRLVEFGGGGGVHIWPVITCYG